LGGYFKTGGSSRRFCEVSPKIKQIKFLHANTVTRRPLQDPLNVEGARYSIGGERSSEDDDFGGDHRRPDAGKGLS
jgi:hypothetical protein